MIASYVGPAPDLCPEGEASTFTYADGQYCVAIVVQREPSPTMDLAPTGLDGGATMLLGVLAAAVIGIGGALAATRRKRGAK